MRGDVERWMPIPGAGGRRKSLRRTSRFVKATSAPRTSSTKDRRPSSASSYSRAIKASPDRTAVMARSTASMHVRCYRSAERDHPEPHVASMRLSIIPLRVPAAQPQAGRAPASASLQRVHAAVVASLVGVEA